MGEELEEIYEKWFRYGEDKVRNDEEKELKKKRYKRNDMKEISREV